LPLLDPTNPTYAGIVPAGTAVYIPEAKFPHAEYSEWLPSLGISYQIDHDTQVFADVARNFRVPANFVFFNYNTSATPLHFAADTTIGGITYGGGLGSAGDHPAGTVWIIGNNIEPELSWTYEAGLRLQRDGLRISGTAFYNQLDNYQATAQLDAGTPTTV